MWPKQAKLGQGAWDHQHHWRRFGDASWACHALAGVVRCHLLREPTESSTLTVRTHTQGLNHKTSNTMSTTFRDSRGASSTTRQSWWLPVLVACHIAPLPVAANVDTVALPTPTLRATHAVFTEGEKDPNGFAVAA